MVIAVTVVRVVVAVVGVVVMVMVIDVTAVSQHKQFELACHVDVVAPIGTPM